MMQAWKYSLPAFLVPFQFSATLVGTNLLILGANLKGFIIALLSSLISLFYLSLGIIGYLKNHISIIERALLIACSIVISFVPIDFKPQGIIPLVVGAIIVIIHFKKK